MRAAPLRCARWHPPSRTSLHTALATPQATPRLMMKMPTETCSQQESLQTTASWQACQQVISSALYFKAHVNSCNNKTRAPKSFLRLPHLSLAKPGPPSWPSIKHEMLGPLSSSGQRYKPPGPRTLSSCDQTQDSRIEDLSIPW